MSDDLRELYQEVILDHGRNPRNCRHPDATTHVAHGHNPLCGDQLDVYLTVGEDDRITEAAFEGRGCAISVASASLMTETLRGKTLTEAKALFQKIHEMCTSDDGGGIDFTDDDFERLAALSGVRQFPMRVKCATLAWHTMKAAMEGKSEVSTEDDS
ncbi:MAG: SUF system NifU family Fe-S cluster assembly protein [Rhodospirillales bacterium]|jgi:nitrogen fixation NifU-like protein|nr:SUF system NifU family Fe-S cluster assembly protein [Rhodospirillales bacterium]